MLVVQDLNLFPTWVQITYSMYFLHKKGKHIMNLLTLCLNNGINGVGIPDLIIAQNARQGGLRLLSNDEHFVIIAKFLSLDIYR